MPPDVLGNLATLDKYYQPQQSARTSPGSNQNQQPQTLHDLNN